MKKIIGFILTGVLMFSCISTSYATTSLFNDIKSSNWAYSGVKSMVEKKIVKGYPDGSFKPSNIVTYGEFIKMVLIACMNEDIGNSTTGNWAKSYYDKALELKLFTTSDINESQLEIGIPRMDMALLINSALDYKAGGKSEYAINGTDGKTSTKTLNESVLKTFADLSTDTKNLQSIVNVYSCGVITGYEDNTFKPNQTLTRAESSTVICRLIDESFRVEPKFVREKTINEWLSSKTVDGSSTTAEFLGVTSVEQLRIEKPMTYYSFLEKSKNPIGDAITNISDIKSATFDCKYYKIVDMKDIGIPSITKVANKYNSEGIEVLPGDGATNAFLIKDNKIVCNLSSADGDGSEASFFFPESTTYYNGSYQNNKLMDFDYIGFWGSTGDTIFLVKKAW